jgi:hypothetical protein
MFSILGFAQTLYFHHVISLGMEILVAALATICAGCSAMRIRFSIQPGTSQAD